ncbi:MAG: trigger factor [Porticoccus sp.]|nr:trigger factor [Porticoccus sp.]
MQVSIETTSGLERKLTIGVPAERIESQVRERLDKASKTVRIDGFRKGKVPLSVVNQRFGVGIRQEVVGDVVREAFFEAIAQEEIVPAGQPVIEPSKAEPGQDLEFIATFEVLPEVQLVDLSKVEIVKPVSEVSDSDVDIMVDALRMQHATWVEVDRPATERDEALIDFVGRRDGEEFEGGSSEDFPLTLGSGKAIEGFEEAVAGMSIGEEKVVPLTFPENYHAEELRGVAVEFTIKLKAVKEPELPELNEEFFAHYGLESGDEAAFRTAVSENMERDLKNALQGKTKSRVMEQLFALHSDLDIPQAFLANEITSLKNQMHQKLTSGGESEFDAAMLPDEMFMDQAKRRAAVGLVVNEIIKANEIKVDSDKVRGHIEEIASTYAQSEEVMNHYYGNQDLLKGMETSVLQDQVIDHVLSLAVVTEDHVDYQTAVTPDPEQLAAEG